MAVLVWNDRDGVLGNSIRTGRRYRLSAEEFRAEAEDLDRALDDMLDMAWHALAIITQHKNGKPRFNSFEQVWILGRAIFVSDIMRHAALLGEERLLLWQALTPKAWYGIRHDSSRDPRWRELIPSRRKLWQRQPKNPKGYRFLDIAYWIREQQLPDAGEVFGRYYSNAEALYNCASLRSLALRQAILDWLWRQSPKIREELSTSYRGTGGFSIVCRALSKRFPAKGPGSALLPQHYAEDELRAIVSQTLDAAVDAHFGH